MREGLGWRHDDQLVFKYEPYDATYSMLISLELNRW